MGVMDGYIMSIFINTDANDMNSFQATVEKYKEMYGSYPEGVSADAGYGSKKITVIVESMKSQHI